VLLSAVIGTQLIATCFALFGWLMPPISWGWALAVWGYALAWFLINDRVKLAAYRILDPKQSALAGRK
jgi:H+-transporting ATPase